MGHLDLMRAFMMAIRRVGLSVDYSEGFNPHMLLYFSPPLPVGLSSLAEYFAASSSECPQDFMVRLNTSLPKGLKILAASKVDKNPNFANMAVANSYEVVLEKASDLSADIAKMLSSTSFDITYTQKENQITKDVRSRILLANGSKKTYTFTLLSGALNLRPDRLMSQLLASINQTFYTSTKTAQYALKTKCTNIETLHKTQTPLTPLINFDELFFHNEIYQQRIRL